MNRFTPTHVGNTGHDRVVWVYHSVHPHACGEHLAERILEETEVGSPPRMWGTQIALRCHAARERFTPTHVGNTRCCAHTPGKPLGSPPRMWGTLGPAVGTVVGGKFTPTHVGNTRKPGSVS